MKFFGVLNILCIAKNDATSHLYFGTTPMVYEKLAALT